MLWIFDVYCILVVQSKTWNELKELSWEKKSADKLIILFIFRAEALDSANLPCFLR